MKDEYVVLFGDISQGVLCVEGPFESHEDAVEYAEKSHTVEAWHVMSLTRVGE